MGLHTIPGEGDMFSCLHVKYMNNTQNRCRKKGDSNQDFLQGPPWHNVKFRSLLTKSEIKMHPKLLHINNSTPQTICFIKQNHKLFH